MRGGPRPRADEPDSRSDALSPFAMERGARTGPAFVRLCGSCKVRAGRGRLVRKEKGAKPVRPSPGSSGVRCPDLAERVSQRHQEIPEERERNLPLDATGILWRSGHQASE